MNEEESGVARHEPGEHGPGAGVHGPGASVPGPGDGELKPGEERPASGLRNPAAAVRGLGAATLAAEGLVLLLAIIPLRVLGARGTAGTLVVVALAMVSFALAGMVRRRWVWTAAAALQVVLLVCGFLVHAALAVVGVLFGLVWLYVLRVRRSVLGD
jgi:hypothetical protein